jgi:hypothetical protein
MNRRIELLAERRLQVPEREIRMPALYRERLLCSGQEESFHIEFRHRPRRVSQDARSEPQQS